MPDRARLCLISEREHRTAPSKGPGTGHSFKIQWLNIAEPEQRQSRKRKPRAQKGTSEFQNSAQIARGKPRSLWEVKRTADRTVLCGTEQGVEGTPLKTLFASYRRHSRYLQSKN